MSQTPAAGDGVLRALIVEDDEDFRDSLARLVEREGYAPRQAGTVAGAQEALAEQSADVVLVDLSLPDGDGLTLVAEHAAGATEFIVITGHATMDTAIDALRAGALDFLTKPVDRGRLKSVLHNVARTRELKHEVAELRDELRSMGRFGRLVGSSEAQQRVYDLIGKVAPTEASVLVTGASGTGKELVAETIHQLSRRRAKPFLAVNCGAMSTHVIESELFGHEKGSFTGADRQRRGYFESAEGGTLFLDEITEMPIELQVKLLRVLETGTVMRVGASKPVGVDVRIIAATNRVPLEAVRDGALREDLYYRLNVFPIPLPPLRERKGDIELLANHFLAEINRREDAKKRWSSEALAELESRAWPGNVRELRNTVERAAILSADLIVAEHLRPVEGTVAAPGTTAVAGGGQAIEIQVGSSLADAERKLLLATLQEVGGDKKRAAEILGISVKTIYNRLSVYDAAGYPVEAAKSD